MLLKNIMNIDKKESKTYPSSYQDISHVPFTLVPDPVHNPLSIEEVKLNDDRPFTIYVQLSDNWIIHFDVRSTDTIGHMKEIIRSKTNILSESQHYQIQNQNQNQILLENDSLLQMCHIIQGTVLKLIPKPHPPKYVHNNLNLYKTFTIFVKMLSGDMITINDMCSVSTISQVHKIIQEKELVHVDKQKLLFKNKILSPNDSLESVSIESGSVVHLVVEKWTIAESILRRSISQYQIFVTTLSGRTMTLDVTSSDTIDQIREKIYKIIQMPHNLQRLIYEGKQLEGNHTLLDYDILSEDTLQLVSRLRGGCVAAPLPSKFITHSNSQICEMQDYDMMSSDETIILDSTCCEILTRYLDSIATNETDLLIPISTNDLVKLIGLSAVHQLGTYFNGPYDSIKLRRVIATGGHIDFHNDYAWRTMQIPLNNPSEYVGGRVIYLIKNNYYAQKRDQGTACIHTNNDVHGVEPLKQGIRYSLFFCETLARIQDNDFFDLVNSCSNELSFYQTFDQMNNSELIACVKEYIESFDGMDYPLSDQKLELIRHAHVLSSECALSINELLKVVKHYVRFMNSLIDMNIGHDEIVQGIIEYRKFMTQLRSNQFIEPSNKLVDFVWHVHMLDQPRYTADCKRILGHTISHTIVLTQ